VTAHSLNHFLFGALRVELRGKRASEVVSVLQLKGFPLYGVQVRSGFVYLTIGLKMYPDLYRTCRSMGVKLRFLSREGLPFLLRNAYRRKAMLVGIATFFCMMYTMSSMIWQVQVSGVKDDTAALILQSARELGVSVGAWKSVLRDVDGLQDKLMQKLPNLVWVGIDAHGTRVKLDALEQIPGVTQSSETPHNIVAAKPAVIRKVFASRGEVVVKPGQVVTPGQLIISGDLGNGVKQVPAQGQVFAEVWYTSTVRIPLKVQQRGLTGESVQRDYLSLGSLRLRVWGFRQPHYVASEERVDETDWRLGNWRLPIQLQQVTVYEASPLAVAASMQEAERNALNVAIQDVRSKMRKDGVILGQNVLHKEVSHGNLYETILTKTEEDIALAAPLQTPAPSTGSPS
jgi:similar to stage IV sporulation protein